MTTTTVPFPRFPAGQLVATPGALAQLQQCGDDARLYLRRHLSADWGDVSASDKRANDQALEVGERLFSAYHLSDGAKIWIITEWDRSATTLLLPEEY